MAHHNWGFRCFVLLQMVLGVFTGVVPAWAQSPGSIVTVAGDGYRYYLADRGAPIITYGRFAGDGSAATLASLYRPQDVGVDGVGNI